jgi:hypothetical protein
MVLQLLFLFLIFLLFVLEKSSRDHSSFFSLGETKKKLSIEVSSLKTGLVLRQDELESERQDRQTVEQALCAQVVEVGKRRDDAMAVMQEAFEKAESLRRECDGTPGSLWTFVGLLYLCFVFALIYYFDPLSEGIKRSSWITSRR